MPNNVGFGVQAKGVAKASSDLDRLRDKFDKLQKTSGKGLLIGAGAGLGLSAVNALSGGVQMATDAFFDAIKAGSDLNETLSKSSVVFGDAAGQVQEFGEHAAKSMGLSENAALGATATFGNLFKSLGTAPEKIAPMSEGLVKLAADLASFNNIPVEDALQKLQSGIVGEIEPMRTLGVAITAATVESEAAALGFKKVNGVFTEGEKVQARYSLIMKQTTTAQGDFARTSNQMANQQRILNAELENTSAKLGQKLVPGMIGAQRAALGFFGTLDILTDGVATTTDAQKDQVDSLSDFEHALGTLFPPFGTLADLQDQAYKDAHKAAAGFDEEGDNSITMAEKLRGGAVKVEAALGGMETAAKDWRDEYRDVTGDIIRRSARVRDALVKDAATIRGKVFDETETRAELHDQRLALFALEEKRRDAKTAEDKRQAADDIIAALDDEGQSLEDLAAQGKLTNKDVDRFAKDAKKNYKDLSADGKKQIDALIEKYRALAKMPNITKTFTLNYKEKKTTFHAPGTGPTEFNADGGRVPKGTVTWVGEKGPELLEMGGDGFITPADMSKRAVSGGTGSAVGGGVTFEIHVHAGVGSGVTASSGRQFAAEFGPAIYADMQRRGLLPRGATGLTG